MSMGVKHMPDVGRAKPETGQLRGHRHLGPGLVVHAEGGPVDRCPRTGVDKDRFFTAGDQVADKRYRDLGAGITKQHQAACVHREVTEGQGVNVESHGGVSFLREFCRDAVSDREKSNSLGGVAAGKFESLQNGGQGQHNHRRHGAEHGKLEPAQCRELPQGQSQNAG